VIRRVVWVQLISAIVLRGLVGRIVWIGLVGLMVLLTHGEAPIVDWRLHRKNALSAEKDFFKAGKAGMKRPCFQ
jgi:hypothetical protein